MSIPIHDKFKPRNDGDFALMDAEDIEMPDGSRLSELSVAPVLAQGAAEIQPEIYYTFGQVSSLAVTLVPVEDGKAHEYLFEFIPAEGFTGLTITPEPAWVADPQYPAGKTCQVSVLRGLAVMGCG